MVTDKGDITELKEPKDYTQKDKILAINVTLQENTTAIDDDTLPDLVIPPHTSNLTNDTLNNKASASSNKQATPPLASDRTVVTTDPPDSDNIDSRYANQTPSRAIAEQESQSSTTPRSVLMDPDADELETAGALLQLGSPNLRDIDKSVDNETIMPVNRTRIEDFAKDMAESESRQEEHNLSDDQDSDKTVEYPTRQ